MTPACFPSLRTCLFLTAPTHGVLQSVSCPVWLLPCSRRPAALWQVSTVQALPWPPPVFIPRGEHTLSTRSPVEGHVGRTHLGATVTRAVESVGVHVPLRAWEHTCVFESVGSRARCTIPCRAGNLPTEQRLGARFRIEVGGVGSPPGSASCLLCDLRQVPHVSELCGRTTPPRRLRRPVLGAGCGQAAPPPGAPCVA